MAFNEKNLSNTNFKDLDFLQDSNSSNLNEDEKKLNAGFQYVIEILNNEYKIKSGNVDIVLNLDTNKELFNSLDGIIKKFRDKDKISSSEPTTIYITVDGNGQIIGCEKQSGSNNKRETIKISTETKNELQKCLHGIQQKCVEENNKVTNSKSINQVVEQANSQALPTQPIPKPAVTANTNS